MSGSIDLLKAIQFASGQPQPGQVDWSGASIEQAAAELERLLPSPKKPEAPKWPQK